jgi:hypothetical protein
MTIVESGHPDLAGHTAWPGNPLNRDGTLAGSENLTAQIGQVVATPWPRTKCRARNYDGSVTRWDRAPAYGGSLLRSACWGAC